jgi:hypothetical protein
MRPIKPSVLEERPVAAKRVLKCREQVAIDLVRTLAAAAALQQSEQVQNEQTFQRNLTT